MLTTPKPDKSLKAFQRNLAERSPHKSNKVMRVLSVLLTFALEEGYLTERPARRLKLRKTDPRAVVWTPEQVGLFCATAIDAGRASVALAVRLAVNLGQQEGDVLRLTWAQHDGGSFSIRQGKTGAFIKVPVTRELADALQATPRASPNIVVSEVTGRPYRADNFRAVFGQIWEGPPG